MKFITVILVVTCLNFVNHVSGVSIEEELTLTHSQKKVLDKFREVMSPRLPHDYMRNSDIYLVRWLRARDFNLQEAEKMLLENLRWRKANRLDEIMKEDWHRFEKDYRYTVEGCDKTGRPVIGIPVGTWDVRKAVIAGQTERMMRYFDKLLEEISVVIRAAQSQGKNVTQYSQVFDLGKYNLIQQGCPICIPIYVHLFTSYEAHFPGGVHKIYLINTPDIFGALLQIIKPLMAKQTRDSLFVYGRDKRVWQEALLEDIDADQLTPEFGGIKEAGYEIEEFRALGKLPC